MFISTFTNNPISVCGPPVYHVSQRIINFTHHNPLPFLIRCCKYDMRTSRAATFCKYSAKFCGVGCSFEPVFFAWFGWIIVQVIDTVQSTCVPDGYCSSPAAVAGICFQICFENSVLWCRHSLLLHSWWLNPPKFWLLLRPQAPNLAFHVPRLSQLGFQCIVT